MRVREGSISPLGGLEALHFKKVKFGLSLRPERHWPGRPVGERVFQAERGHS